VVREFCQPPGVAPKCLVAYQVGEAKETYQNTTKTKNQSTDLHRCFLRHLTVIRGSEGLFMAFG
jgi:hypothetical protein